MEKSGVTPHYLHRDSLTSKLFFVCGLIVIAVLVCITVKLEYFTIAICVDYVKVEVFNSFIYYLVLIYFIELTMCMIAVLYIRWRFSIPSFII